MKVVHAAKGVYVQGLAQQTGRRYTKVKESGKKKRGGARKKGDYSMSHLQKITRMHRDLQAMRKEEREMGHEESEGEDSGEE